MCCQRVRYVMSPIKGVDRDCSVGSGEPVLRRASSVQVRERSVERRLSQGQRALRCIRCRVSGAMLTIGVAGTVLCQLHYAWRKTEWLAGVSWLGQVFSIGILSLAPLSDDLRLTRVVHTINGLIMLSYLPIDLADIPAIFPTEDLPCLDHAHSKVFCTFEVVFSVCYAVVDVVFFLAAVAVLCTAPAQQLQGRMWKVLAGYFGVQLLIDSGFSAYWLALHGELVWTAFYLFGDVIGLAMASLPAKRAVVQAWLRQLFDRHQANAAAAGIASLVGDCPVKSVMQQATSRFRSLQFSHLSREDMADNSPGGGLFLRTQLTRLGHCDAFVSHSWHDDAAVKWQALQGWRDSFVRQHGREPSIWLDKGCIDQSCIEADLRCLPIFMTGCKRLVILCGPTYLRRLWCVIELFTFVHMGGLPARVDLVPLLRQGREAEDEEAIDQGFAHFDAGACECSKSDDKDRMLTIIHTAYGGLASFNAEVRRVMDEVGWRGPLGDEEGSSELNGCSGGESSDTGLSGSSSSSSATAAP